MDRKEEESVLTLQKYSICTLFCKSCSNLSGSGIRKMETDANRSLKLKKLFTPMES